jgi:hypothetical protein
VSQGVEQEVTWAVFTLHLCPLGQSERKPLPLLSSYPSLANCVQPPSTLSSLFSQSEERPWMALVLASSHSQLSYPFNTQLLEPLLSTTLWPFCFGFLLAISFLHVL